MDSASNQCKRRATLLLLAAAAIWFLAACSRDANDAPRSSERFYFTFMRSIQEKAHDAAGDPPTVHALPFGPPNVADPADEIAFAVWMGRTNDVLEMGLAILSPPLGVGNMHTKYADAVTRARDLAHKSDSSAYELMLVESDVVQACEALRKAALGFNVDLLCEADAHFLGRMIPAA